MPNPSLAHADGDRGRAGLRIPRVILLGRLSLYGQGAERLHEETVWAVWEGDLRRMSASPLLQREASFTKGIRVTPRFPEVCGAHPSRPQTAERARIRVKVREMCGWLTMLPQHLSAPRLQPAPQVIDFQGQFRDPCLRHAMLRWPAASNKPFSRAISSSEKFAVAAETCRAISNSISASFRGWAAG